MSTSQGTVGTMADYSLDDRGVGVQVLVVSRIFSSPHHSHRLWAHPASYPLGSGVSFPGGKAAGL
jgi:hypothetical protein